MPNDLDPRVGQWYRHLGKGQRFYITAIDDNADTVQIQHADGDSEEFSFEQWRGLDIALGAETANWSAPMDQDVRDPQGDVTSTSEADWDAVYREHHLRGAAQRDLREESGLRDDFGERPPTRELPLEDNRQGQARNRTGHLHDRGDGVFEEVFDNIWSAEYTQDARTGRWRVVVYRAEASEWRNIGLDSLEQARAAAQDFVRQT